MKKDRRVTAEVKRLRGLLIDADVSERRLDALSAIIENVAFMTIKLNDAREYISSTNVVIKYDNGGGQIGIRENPAIKGYESLFKSYMSGMCRILDALPQEAQQAAIAPEQPKTVLELVRKKHSA